MKRRGASALAAATTCACALASLSVGACKDDYLVVRLRATDPAITLSPVDIAVSVSSSGKRSSFTYSGTFAPPPEGSTEIGSSDFVVSLGAGTGEALEIAAFATGSSRQWGGDARFTLPADRRTVEIPIFSGGVPIDPSRVTEGDAQTSALFGTGLVLAWPDLDGVSYRVERDAERIGARARPIAREPNAGSIRVVSRPRVDGSGVGPDLAAIAWHGESGALGLRTVRAAADGENVSIGQGSDVHVACMPAGGTYDAVAVALEKGRVWATFHGRDGNDAATGGPPIRVAVALPEAFTVRGVLGVLDGVDNTFITLVRGGGDRVNVQTSLLRVKVDGSIVERVELDPDVRAVARAADGSRLLLAVVTGAGDAAALELVMYDARSLQRAGTSRRLAWMREIPTGTVARVSLADCVAVWPQSRGDGTAAIDLRYLYLDAQAVPFGAPHRVNVALEGDAFAPTAVCASPTRAYVSYIARTDPSAFSGQLRLRTLPPPTPVGTP